MIIIEGVDNSGKSSLARYLASYLNCSIKESEGPPRDPAEFDARIRKYDAMKPNTIVVRHPIISESIYCLLRDGQDIIDPAHRQRLAEKKPLVIYCDPLDRGMADHVVKDHDSPEHLERLTDRYTTLLGAYRSWAYRSAHLIYRIGDDKNRVARMAFSLARGC